MKIPSMVAELFPEDKRTWAMMKLTADFHDFMKARKSSAFCPHGVFLCLVWFSEKTAIISLYGIGWFVYITNRLFLAFKGSMGRVCSTVVIFYTVL